MTPTYEAQTAYRVAIPKSFADFKAAVEWAEANAETFPGCRIVRKAEGRPDRTVWKHETEVQEARAA